MKTILKNRRAQALFIRDKIAANGTPLERDDQDCVKYQKIVDECKRQLDFIPSTLKTAEKEAASAKRNRSPAKAG